ncbi:hypothetical protein [Pedobacter alluvionis]|uniref:Uncharacterized protein n=1 Tax=Pedobacter alluvionis TaxID=475253 RepID=A0A497Y858_9SPHI|nr:hypothetical protein [Pedobacter alluvionis]RLJ79772.1 hypothetical protein BCL90_0482 [Pedobacter alluvionis]TFB31086.1 hypothetical protein E3V97_10750 [Pedobacter alluvionis]
MAKKTKKRYLRIFVFLMLLLPLGAIAQTPPDAYLCGTGTVKLTPTFTGYAPAANDKIIWSVDGTPQAAVIYTTAADAIYNVPATLATGRHTYSVQVQPADANLCPSDASDNTVVEKLPTPLIDVAAPGSTYCTDQTANTVITASKGASITLPTGVTMTYVWSATLGGTAVADITTLGAASASGDTFTLKAGVTPGAYVFTATGSYATGGVQIVPATTCTATESKAITVTAKPGKATIAVAP